MSLYLPDKKAFFIHIQRTGGGWVDNTTRNTLKLKAMRTVGLCPHTIQYNHRPAGTFCLDKNREYQTKEFSKLVFDFLWSQVRHPVEYYKSVWGWLIIQKPHMLNRIKMRWTWDSLMRPAQLLHEDFNVWVERMLEDQGAWVTRLFWTFLGPPGAEFCQYIGRTETLKEDYIRVMNMLGYAITLEQVDGAPPVHQSRIKRPDIYWRDDLLARVLYEERLAVARWYGTDTKDKRLYSYADPNNRRGNRALHKNSFQAV